MTQGSHTQRVLGLRCDDGPLGVMTSLGGPDHVAADLVRLIVRPGTLRPTSPLSATPQRPSRLSVHW